MSYIYSLALVAAYSAANCSDTDASAQLSESHTPKPSWWHDKTMEPSRHSRFGMTYAPLTESLGAELLMWWQEDFLAKTSALPETGPDWTASDPGYGQKWQGSLAKYDHATHSLKTAQLSLLEDLTGCFVTLPRWGSMRNGELFQRPIPALRICGNESGFWPTPNCIGYRSDGELLILSRQLADREEYLAMSHRACNSKRERYWPTPQASDNRDRGNASTPAIKSRIENGKQVMLSMCVSSESGRLNPNWVEWLMGWPIGHTDLKPLETDRLAEWLRQHSPSFQECEETE